MEAELKKKISEYGLKLEQLTGPEDKRVKKRVLQALGKLKKQLSGLGSANDIDEDVETEGSLDDGENSIQKKQKQLNTSPAVPEITLTRKQLKAKLKLLNKELAEYAQKKQLKLAVKRYNWGVKKGMEPDKHTFANLMNAYVRCGDLDGALSQFTTMQSMNVEGNIVIYTTLLKGYCDRGDLTGASNLLFLEIPKNSLSPGIRTVNTFVRGCTKTGAVGSAVKAFRLIQNTSQVMITNDNINDSINKNGETFDDSKSTNTKTKNSNKKRRRNDDDGDEEEDANPVSSDASSLDNEGKDSLYESVVALLCQNLQIEDASVLAVEAISLAEANKGVNTSNKTDYASIYMNLSKACVFIGKHREGEKWLECAIAALESTKNYELRNSMQLNRNKKEGGVVEEGKRTRSLDLFLRHRRSEIEGEVEAIGTYLTAIKSNISDFSAINDLEDNLEMLTRLGLYSSLSRILYFGFNGKGDYDDNVNGSGQKNVESDAIISANLLYALRDKFGLDKIQILDSNEKSKKKLEKNENTKNNGKLKNLKKLVVKKLLKCVSHENGYIDYKELFSDINCIKGKKSSPDNQDDTEKCSEINDSAEVPIYIEICSGSGI